MIAVHRGTPPVELNRNIHELASDQRTYNNLSADTKTALKKSLLESQGHICAYCMCRIDGPEDAKLEHIYPQSRSIAEGNPGKTLDYGNMLAVCKGGDGDPSRPHSEQTCDTHKGDAVLSINPSSQDDIDTIYYLPNGEIGSSNAAFDDDLCKTLNLNCEAAYLPQNRQRVYASMQHAIAKRAPRTHEAKREFARKKLMALEASDCKEPFVGVMLYRLKKWAR